MKKALIAIGLLVSACGGAAPSTDGAAASVDETGPDAGGGVEASGGKQAAAPPAADKAAAQADPVVPAPAQASAPAGTDAELAALRETLARRIPELSDAELRRTPLEGVFELSRGLAVGYVSADGRYLLEGDMVDLATGRQITEERRRTARVDMLEAAAEQAIVFAPEGETRHTVSVFTDIDCGYCRKLHSEIEDYTERGIAIRYLLYPRAGKDSSSYVKAVSAWCSDTPAEALTRAKQGKAIPETQCANPVDAHLALGQRLGLRGTPMMVLPDGEVVQGYVPADALQARLSDPPAAEPLASR